TVGTDSMARSGNKAGGPVVGEPDRSEENGGSDARESAPEDLPRRPARPDGDARAPGGSSLHRARGRRGAALRPAGRAREGAGRPDRGPRRRGPPQLLPRGRLEGDVAVREARDGAGAIATRRSGARATRAPHTRYSSASGSPPASGSSACPESSASSS